MIERHNGLERRCETYLVAKRSHTFVSETSLQAPSSKSMPSFVFPDPCPVYREAMISIALRPALSARVLGTNSKLSAYLEMAYLSNLKNQRRQVLSHQSH